MRRNRRAVRCALLPLALITVALLAACDSGGGLAADGRSPGASPSRTTTTGSVLTGRLGGGTVPARFVAMANWSARPGIVLYDSRTGAVIRRLRPATSDGMSVTGLSVDPAGNLWVTYTRGPTLRAAGTLSGFPEAHTCASEIVVWPAGSRHSDIYLRSGNNVLISGASVSPDGRLLAYSESGCATGYFDSYVRVTQVATGRSWTIGQQLPRCYLIHPAWTANSRGLVVAYAPPPRTRYRGPQNTCSQPLREELVEASATAAQPGLTGRTVQAQAHCEITSAAELAGAQVLAIEACGRGMYLAGPARLLVYDRQLRLVRQFPLGYCTDGNDISTDASATAALVSAYLYCNPPGTRQPVTRLWSYSGGVLRPIARLPQGTLAYAFMTW
jgi:hypothetical protein